MEVNDKEAHEEQLGSWLKDRLPEQARDNRQIFAVWKMVVASIAYNRSYLKENLHPDSILRSTALWGEDILFEDRVTVKHEWDKTADTPEITGLPPDIVLLAKLESMKLEMAALKAELKASFESTLVDQLNQRGIGGSGYTQGNEILKKLDALLQEVSLVSCAPSGGPALPAAEAMLDLGCHGGFVVEEEEEDVVFTLNKPERMSPNKCTRIIHQTTREQLAKHSVKDGFHHGLFNPLPAS